MSPDPLDSVPGVGATPPAPGPAPLSGLRSLRPTDAAGAVEAVTQAGGLQPFMQNLLLLVMGLLTGGEARWQRRWVPESRQEERPEGGGGDGEPPRSSKRRIDMGEGRQPAVMRQGKRIGLAMATDFDAMVEAARLDGVALRLVSGYRSYAEQVGLHHRFAPGQEELFEVGPHEEGLALDFANTPGAFTWLRRNARRFGFHGGHPDEPWHFSTDGR